MSSQLKETFLSPVGRLVQGHPMEKQDKNMQGQPLMTQAGQPTQRYFNALAFPKSDPTFAPFYAQLVKVARQSFPHLFDAAGNCTHPRFSWKLIDGDGVDDNGKPNSSKEGFAGHWVVKFQSSFPPRCFYAGRYQPHEQIQDANAIRRGYYGRVSGTIEGNGNAQKPGLYVNLSMFELSAQGPEITSGPDAAAVFGGAPVAALPMGATALPSAGAQPAMPGAPGTTYTAPPQPSFPGAGPGGPAAVAPVPGAQPMIPGLPAALPVQPNPAFAAGPGAGVPQVPGMPSPPQAPPAPPAGPQLTPAALAAAPGFTLAQWQAQGWTEATLRQSGYLA